MCSININQNPVPFAVVMKRDCQPMGIPSILERSGHLVTAPIGKRRTNIECPASHCECGCTEHGFMCLRVCVSVCWKHSSLCPHSILFTNLADAREIVYFGHELSLYCEELPGLLPFFHACHTKPSSSSFPQSKLTTALCLSLSLSTSRPLSTDLSQPLSTSLDLSQPVSFNTAPTSSSHLHLFTGGTTANNKPDQSQYDLEAGSSIFFGAPISSMCFVWGSRDLNVSWLRPHLALPSPPPSCTHMCVCVCVRVCFACAIDDARAAACRHKTLF